MRELVSLFLSVVALKCKACGSSSFSFHFAKAAPHGTRLVSQVEKEDRVLTLYKNGSCEITQILFEIFGREKSSMIEQEPFL